MGVALDASDNLYIADWNNHRIRKVDAATGFISTVAGTGTSGFSGDGAAATAAQLNSPHGVAVDASGNLFIADTYNQRIRKVDAVTKNISTVAGNGTAGFGGDGAAATAAQLNWPDDVAVDASGNLFIADTDNRRIRKVGTDGNISTVAGTGRSGFSGDGAAATAAQLYRPYGVALDASDNLYIADTYNNRIRKVDAATGNISTVAGDGTSGFSGDDGPAVQAQLSRPYGVALDSSGNLFIADRSNTLVRKVDAATGFISTVAGDGTSGFGGDGGAATAARLSWPEDVAVDASGNLFIADTSNNRIRKVDFTATVTPGPTATLTASPATITAGQSSTLTVASTNAVSAVIQPGNHTVTLDNTGTGSAAVSPTITTTYTLTVTDANGATAVDTATVTVNAAPTANAGPDQIVAEGDTVTLDGSDSSDPENETLTYAWTQTSGKTVTLSNATTASPSFTAPTQLAANAALVFSLTVSDGANTSTADTVTITVTAGTNDKPTANAGADQTVDEGDTVTLDGSGSSDPEGEALTYAWSQTSGETVTLSNATTASPSFTAPTQLAADAALVFSLTVTDARNLASTADTVTITVTAGTNDAPTANAGADQTVAEGDTVTLDGSGSSDPENETLTYAWTQTSGETVTLSNAATASPTFTAPTQLVADAALVFSLTVTDARNAASTADTVTITVTAGTNDKPTANAGADQTVAEGASVTLDGSGSSDPEGETLTYAWSQTSGETVSLSDSTAASPTFTAPTQLTADERLVFSLTVTDARNAASTADTVTITVTAGTNDAPTANAGPDQTVSEGATVTLDGSASSDPEGETLSYAWFQTSGQTVTLNGANTASPTFTAPTELTADAALVFSLTVTDARNAASTADTVTVTAGTNDAPTANAGPD